MRIKIFLTSSCHYCNKAKEYLKKRGADFIDCNVWDNPDAAKEKVQADSNDAGSYGVSGTPSFFVNGKLLVGAQPYEAFQQVIDAEL